jgi:cell wall-associated NlpC family hydrolase
VPSVRTWAESQGRYIPAGQGPPAVGDLVVFDRGGTGVLDHIGIVTGVGADGGIRTIEGNSGDAVSARSYEPGGYAGLVRLG